MNIILNTDSYKPSHYLQYPKGTKYISSYIESRGGAPRSLFAGLQRELKKYFSTRVTMEDVLEAEEVFNLHGVPFNKEGWVRIVEKCGGKLPVSIEAVPEGTVVPTRNILVQITNTDPEFPWLVSYLETALLRAVWYPTTVATTSFELRMLFEKFAKDTAKADYDAAFALNDFGSRGASSYESSAIGGLGHLISFAGTDNLAAIMNGRKYYNEPMAGFSIPAAEHSTITSWNDEKAAFSNMIDQFAGKDKMYAVVSDSYDYENAVTNLWGKELKFKVLEAGGRLVVRPDSGDPTEMVLKTLEWLGKSFGYITNCKKYKVLNDSVRIIQGDGVNPTEIEKILTTMKAAGWSSENVAFGMGGALLQGVNRDTQKFAMKQNAIKYDGDWIDVYKRPATDNGKASKAGRRMLIQDTWGNWSSPRVTYNYNNQLREVFRDGEVLVDEDFSTIRARSKRYWDK